MNDADWGQLVALVRRYGVAEVSRVVREIAEDEMRAAIDSFESGNEQTVLTALTGAEAPF